MVRVSQQEKDLSHQRIVASAARLIRERGVDGAGVAEVMKDAGMTAGGFYRHFASKDDLIAAALDTAFAQTLGRLDAHDEQAAGGRCCRRVRTLLPLRRPCGQPWLRLSHPGAGR